MKNNTVPFLSIAAFLLTSTSLATAQSVKFWEDNSRTVTVAAPGLYPEGIETHPKTGEFLLSSIRQGKVIALSDDGTIRTFVEDDRLRSVIGIRVDKERGRLLINNSDYGFSERSEPSDTFSTVALGIYDLETGAPLQYVDLAGLRGKSPQFVNDIAIDAGGNAYLTDSVASAIYKVTPSGKASVLVTHERFGGEGFNLNGIQYHENGYLLVAKKSAGTLFKVPLDNPAGFSEVKLPQALMGMDGLVITNSTEMIAIANIEPSAETNAVFKLVSDDDWASASIKATFATGDTFPTTGTIKDGKLYVNYGRLNALRQSVAGEAPFLQEFHIQEVGEINQ